MAVLHDSYPLLHSEMLCEAQSMQGCAALQVKVGERLPTVELVMSTAADPAPHLFVTTDDLFQGQEFSMNTPVVACSF